MSAKWSCRFLAVSVICLALGHQGPSVLGQDKPIVRLERLNLSGTLASVFPGEIMLKDDSGQTQKLLIHGDEAVGVRVKGNSRLLRHPAKIKVTGEFKPQAIAPGSQVRIEARLTRQGQCREVLQQLKLIADNSSSKAGITVKEEGTGAGAESLCEVIGLLDQIR